MKILTQQEEDRVAIAAAVKALFGPTATIRGSKPAVQAAREGAWTRDGRIAVQSSHREAQERGRKR